ncbi:MAG: hypothetical protein AAB455_02065 [Patescibacteria group bacterium]
MALWTFARNRHGNLNVPYLIENGGQVIVNWHWLDNDWNASDPALRFANRFISPPILSVGGVLFYL